MKKTSALLLAVSLVVATTGNALADRGHYGKGYYGGHRHHHEHSHRQGQGWIGPAAILAITGLAIGAAAYSQAQATPTYAMPQPAYQPPPPDSGNWYYCNSSGQYYPYVRGCPEGWQAVMPPR